MSNKKRVFWIVLILLILLVSLYLVVRMNLNRDVEFIDSECLQTNIEIINVINTGENNYDVTLMTKNLTKEREIGGVALVFTDSKNYLNEIHYISNKEYPMNDLMTNITVSTSVNNLSNADKIKLVVYFLHEYESEEFKQFCPVVSEYTLA